MSTETAVTWPEAFLGAAIAMFSAAVILGMLWGGHFIEAWKYRKNKP